MLYICILLSFVFSVWFSDVLLHFAIESVIDSAYCQWRMAPFAAFLNK